MVWETWKELACSLWSTPSTSVNACKITLKKMRFCWCAFSFRCFISSQFPIVLLFLWFFPLSWICPHIWVLSPIHPVPPLVARSFPFRRSVCPCFYRSKFWQHDWPHLQLWFGLGGWWFYSWRWHRRGWQVYKVEKE